MNVHKKPTVFISYSHADSHFVDTLAERLKDSGVDVWIDKWKIRVGDSITGKIDEGIGVSDFLVIVLSRSSVKSKWVREELNTAFVKNVEVEKGAFILPVLMEACEIPALLSHRKYANFKDDLEQGFQELIEVIQPEAAGTIDTLTIRSPIRLELIRIPSGEFLMGSDPKKDEHAHVMRQPKHPAYLPELYTSEEPQHRVYVSEFYISKYPITNLEYQSFLQDTGYEAPRGFDKKLHEQAGENHPIIGVSWKNAVAFCAWMSKEAGKPFRLPTEAEWEKAARGTDGRIYPWGNNLDSAKCNSAEGGVGSTTPVGKYSPEGDSPYGVADMAGNVWEWCADWFDREAYKGRSGMVVKNPRGPKEGRQRVFRGGSWLDDQRLARCACRNEYLIVTRRPLIGFRVVVSQADSES